jgi:hypothetical protein
MHQEGPFVGGGQGWGLIFQNTGVGLSGSHAQRAGNDWQIAVGLSAEGGGNAGPLHRHGIAALVVQDLDNPACCIRAVFSKGGKSLPRRSARLKIPAQAFGDKEYFSGAFSSKICDKKQAPAPLCCSEMLGVVHAPSEINASASRHSGVCPLSRSRH